MSLFVSVATRSSNRSNRCQLPFFSLFLLNTRHMLREEYKERRREDDTTCTSICFLATLAVYSQFSFSSFMSPPPRVSVALGLLFLLCFHCFSFRIKIHHLIFIVFSSISFTLHSPHAQMANSTILLTTIGCTPFLLHSILDLITVAAARHRLSLHYVQY